MSRTSTTARRLAGAAALSAVLATSAAAGAQATPVHAPRHHCPPSACSAPAPRAVPTTKASTSTTSRTTTSRTTTTASRTTSTSSSTSTSTAATSSSSTSAVTYASTTSISTAGLSADAVKVLKAVNAQFPQITTIYGVRSGSDAEDHATGHALDLMIPNYGTAAGKALGNQVAAYLKAHQSELGVHYVIWSQHIWNVQRDAEGWRSMADRGSTTANHYDHVHVSVY